MRDYLTAKNVRLLIVSVPQKYQVYPEVPCPRARRTFIPTAFDKLRAYLTDRFKRTIIDAKAILMRLKAEGHQVCRRIDYHWTDWAGGEVGRAITNRIAELEGRSDLAWTAAIPDKRFAGWGGGRVQFLPLFRPITEDTRVPDVDGTTQAGIV